MMNLTKEFIVLKSKEKLRHCQLKDLKKYLGVYEEPEDDFITVADARMSGTCEWFSAKRSYLKWRDFASDAPSVLWLCRERLFKIK